MAELMFKRGAQTALDTIIENKQAIDGCFYLTEDTNRLYVGQGDNTAPVLLNQTVQVVKTLGDLPGSPPAADNDFYYVKDLNILAIYDSTATTESKWVQINPDTDTNDIVKVDNIGFEKTSSSDDEVVYTLTLSQKKYDIDQNEVEDENLQNLTATLSLKSADIAGIVPEAAKVGLKAEDLISGVKILTAGDGSDPETLVNLLPGQNIDDISADEEGNITINAHNNTYEVEVVENGENSVNIQLTDNTDVDNSFVTINAGQDIAVTGDASNDSITISHSIYDTESVTVENDEKLYPEDVLHIISGITLDNGHITAISTDEVKMPFDSHLVDGVSHEDGSWVATFADNNENKWDIDFSGDATLLRNELTQYIDQGLAAANTALTYKGTIVHPSSLDYKVSVEVGDVYLLTENVSTDEHDYRTGDIFIATSLSGAAGVLEDDDLQWTYVPSGNEMIIDTHFKGVANVSGKAGVTDDEDNGSAMFHVEAQKTSEGDDNTPEDNESLKVVAGQDLEIINKTTSGSRDKVATLRHKDITTTNASDTVAEDTFKINAIVDVEVDNGHVTKLTTKTYKVATYDISGSNNKIALGDSAGNESHIDVSDDDTWINATVENNTLKIEHAGPGAAATDTVVTNNPTNLAQEGTLNIISGVHYDDKGHVTQVDTQSLKMPKDTTYEYYIGNGETQLTGDAVAENPSLVLKDRDENKWAAQLYSANDSLEIKGDANKVTFNLVWGSF